MTNDELIQQLQRMEQKIAKLEALAHRNRISDFSKIKKRLTKRVLIPICILCFLVVATFAFAATIPNSFTSGDPISASQMNENFSYIIERLWEVTGANLYYSTGNVGIGTSSPSEKLEVIGTVDADAFTINGTTVGTSTDTYWNDPSAPDIGYTAGKVGIGTASPNSLLDVEGSAGSVAQITINQTGANDWMGLRLERDGAERWMIGLDGASDKLLFRLNSASNPVVIDTAGNVGIGTTGPTNIFHVMENNATSESVQIMAHQGGTGDSVISWIVPGRRWYSGIDNDDGDKWKLATTGGAMSFAADTVLTVQTNGNVGIGTPAPAYKLDVAGDINTTGDIRKSGTAYTNPDYVFEPDYKLMPMDKLTSFLDKNKHLPGMPSTKTVKEKGVRLFEQNRLILEKLEEAYLYIIEQNKKIEDQNRKHVKLEATFLRFLKNYNLLIDDSQQTAALRSQ